MLWHSLMAAQIYACINPATSQALKDSRIGVLR
jgi:hypothetical protein